MAQAGTFTTVQTPHNTLWRIPDRQKVQAAVRVTASMPSRAKIQDNYDRVIASMPSKATNHRQVARPPTTEHLHDDTTLNLLVVNHSAKNVHMPFFVQSSIMLAKGLDHMVSLYRCRTIVFGKDRECRDDVRWRNRAFNS